MKRATRFLAMLVVIAMIACMAPTAFAAGDGSITITNAVKDQVYTVYKIADLRGSDDDGNYSYQISDPKWEYFLETTWGIPVDVNGYITYNDSIVSRLHAQFAQEALAYAIDNGLAVAATATASADGALTISGLDLGYYVVDSSLGTLCALTTANGTVEIIEKNGVPVINKYVKENSLGNYDKANDDYIGATVEYLVEISVAAGAINYIVSDTMSDGLTFDPTSIDVYYGTDVDGHIAVGYTLLQPDADGDGTVDSTFDAEMTALYGNEDWKADADTKEYWESQTFILFIDNANDTTAGTAGVRSIPEKTMIQVEYNAVINQSAVINGPNPNTVSLWYGNDPKSQSSESTVNTYVWNFGILKFAAEGTQHVALAGAKFVLYDSTCSADAPFHLRELGVNADGIPTYEYVKPSNIKKETVEGVEKAYIEDADGSKEYLITEIVTSVDGSAAGRFIIQGLDSGTFYLHETEAPVGYNPLNSDITVIISHGGTYGSTLEHYVPNTNADGYIEVQNYTGTVLPSTGAEGTIIFVTIGMFLVLSMGVLLVVKKRMTQVVFTK